MDAPEAAGIEEKMAALHLKTEKLVVNQSSLLGAYGSLVKQSWKKNVAVLTLTRLEINCRLCTT